MWQAHLGEPSGRRYPTLTEAAGEPSTNLCFNGRQIFWIYFPRFFHMCLSITHVEACSILLGQSKEERWAKEEEKEGGKNCSQISDPLGVSDGPKKQPLGREMRLSAGFPGVLEQLESSKARRWRPKWDDWMHLAARRLHTSCWPGRA